MNIFSPQEVLGLDIGRRFIKAVVMRKGKAGIEAVNASLVKIESTPQQDEQERGARVMDALQKTLEEVGRKTRKVALSCPGQSVFIRLVKLPPVAKGKLKQIVQYETQQQIPFSLEDVIWDYHLLACKEKAETGALILAVKKEIVLDILNLILPMKLEVELLDFTPLAIYNTLHYSGEISGDKITAIIDMGAQSTDITIVEAGEIAMVRPIPLGGDSLTTAIARSFEISFNEAEEIKENEAFIPVPEKEVSTERERKLFSALQPVLDGFLDEIRRSIGYYRSQLRGSVIGNLILTGGGIQLKNIDSFIGENLRIQVTRINPFDKLPLPADVLSRFPEPSVFSAALGMGLRLLGEGRIRTNLLPDNSLQRIEFKKKEPLLILSFVIILLTILVHAGIIRQKSFREDAVLKELNDAIAKYSELEKTLKPKQDRKKELFNLISQFEKIGRRRTSWMDILNEVTCLIPDKIILESFSPAIKETRRESEAGAPRLSPEFAGVVGERAREARTKQIVTVTEGIRLEGLSQDFDPISEFISHLEASPMFEKVEVDSSSGKKVKLAEGEFVKFILVIEINKEAFK